MMIEENIHTPGAPATMKVQPGPGAYLPAWRRPACARRRRFFRYGIIMLTR